MLKHLFPVSHFSTRYSQMFREANLTADSDQIQFHLYHLSEYLERFSGISRIKDTPPFKFKNDLLFCLLGGARCINRYFQNQLSAAFLCLSESSETISDFSDEYYPIHKSAPYYPPAGKTDAEIITKIHQQLTEGIGAYSKPGFDYAKTLLKASRKDSEALEIFLQNCYSGTGSAAGGEMNMGAMLGLLLRWGDADFSKVVSKQDKAVRKDLIKRFRLEPFRKFELENFKSIFPLTAKACSID